MRHGLATAEILCGISCNVDSKQIQAALPLFENGEIEVLEWSFDTLFGPNQSIPPWFDSLLKEYSKNNRLIAHGVFYSLISGAWTVEQENWLTKLKTTASTYNFQHITEHFGFFTGKHFHQGAPLSVPFNQTTLEISKSRIAKLYEACQRPVGIENLAFAFSKNDVEKHGQFLREIVADINGFIILDLHNIYCQAINFDIDFMTLVHLYPLDKVREIHLSGGTWVRSKHLAEQKIRRDTHDSQVPTELFRYLELVLPITPNVQYVILEQIGGALNTPAAQAQFRADFYALKKVVKECNQSEASTINDFSPSVDFHATAIVTCEKLALEQGVLSDILENSPDLQVAKNALRASCLKNTDWEIENWEDQMLETAIDIAKKWQHGFG